MMSKFLTIVAVLVAIGAVGYIGYDRYQESIEPSPVAVVNDPVGCIAESYSSMDEWSAHNRAFVMAKKDQVDEVAKLCNETGLTIVSKHASGESKFALLICAWSNDIDEQKIDVVRNHSAVEFIDVHTQLKEQEETKVKSWDLKSWIDPLEEGAKPQGGDDAQHDSTTTEQGIDQPARIPSDERSL